MDDVIDPKILQTADENQQQANGKAKTSDKKATKNGSPPVVLISKKMINNDESFDENYNAQSGNKSTVDDKSDSRSTTSRDDTSVMSGDLDNLSLSSTLDAANEESDTLAPLPSSSSRQSGNVSASLTKILIFSTNPISRFMRF